MDQRLRTILRGESRVVLKEQQFCKKCKFRNLLPPTSKNGTRPRHTYSEAQSQENTPENEVRRTVDNYLESIPSVFARTNGSRVVIKAR